MELFKSFVNIMAYASVGFSAVAAYLKMNKVWKRKHNAEVANSVSVVGNVVDIIPLTFFSLYFLMYAQWQGFIDSVIWVVAGIVSVMIGAGVWVPENRRKSFWAELKEALRLERSEVGHLACAMFRPSGADSVVKILTSFAYLDRELEPREKDYIETFAEKWHVKLDWDKHRSLASSSRADILIRTRNAVLNYLRISPPTEQVSQLIDLLTSLAKIDDDVSDEESLMLLEAKGLLSSYVDEGDQPSTFAVVIAPQNEGHDAALAILLPDARKVSVAGGTGYVVGSYYSHEFAEMIRDQYRAMGYFTVDVGEPVEIAE